MLHCQCIVCHLHGSVMQSASWSLYHNSVTMFIFIPVLLSCNCLIEICITWLFSVNSRLFIVQADTIKSLRLAVDCNAKVNIITVGDVARYMVA